MPDEHESAVAAWLADPTAKREVKILKERFPSWHEADLYQFAILVEILSGMDFYGELSMEDDDPPEMPPPWMTGR